MQSREWLERTELLIGKEGLDILSGVTVLVAGLGGVGAFAAEMCARAGIGSMLILDSDVVSLSNLNRQLIALRSNIGKSKVSVMRERLLDINPDLKLTTIEEYLDDENVSNLLSTYKIDFIIDAIDTLSPKISLIKYAQIRGIPLVSSMGAGAKFDITGIRIADISKSFNCPLAYILRKRLRKEGISKGFKVVFSQELPKTEAIVPVEERNKKSMVGTISYVPAAFGLACAQVAITSMLGDK